jgi:hypothetical protein
MRSRRGLQLDPLESRTLLAGDVAVLVMDDAVVLRGDPSGNRVLIAPAGPVGASAARMAPR